ncbi:hypothetical protein HZA55_10360 [Candidatus Poribacteria bacterium]|nr:hypothetical protein [Candidatus Poribacteria bacterium]
MQANESLTNIEMFSDEFKQEANCIGIFCKLMGKPPLFNIHSIKCLIDSKV